MITYLQSKIMDEFNRVKEDSFILSSYQSKINEILTDASRKVSISTLLIGLINVESC